MTEFFSIFILFLSIEYACRRMTNRQSESGLIIIRPTLIDLQSLWEGQKMHISKGQISSYLNNLLPSQLYELQSIQGIRNDPWYTYTRPWYFYRIRNSCDSAAFDILFHFFAFFGSDPISRHGVSL